MLASTLTLDDEEEVQEELRAIQEGIVDKTTSMDLPSVPTTEPVKSKGGNVKLRFFSPAALIISVAPESEPTFNKIAVPM